MAKKKSTPKINAGNFTSDSEAKISNAKGKWGQVKKIAKRVQDKAKTLSYDELKDLAREYNAKLPKGSKKRISLKQSGEKISAALGIKPAQEKELKPQPTEKKSPAKTGEAWGKTLDKVEQGKPKLSAEAKGDFRKQVKEAAKKLVADKPKVEIEKPAPKETIDGLVKVIEAKKKEIKSKDGKDKSTSEGYTKSELYNLAKDAKVPGYSRMNKQQLFDSLGLGKKKEEGTSLLSTKKDSSVLGERRGKKTTTQSSIKDYPSNLGDSESETEIAKIKQRNYDRVLDYGQKELQSILEKADKAEAFESYRQSLFKGNVSGKEVKKFVDSIEYHSSFKKAFNRKPNPYHKNYSKEDFKEDLVSLYQATGGNITTIKIIGGGGTGYSTPTGQLGIGSAIYDSERQREVVFHEIAHHIEYSLPQELRDLTTHFLLQRAKGRSPKPMYEIDPIYSDGGLAYPGEFVHPYVGRVYDNNTTEVLSMGTEHLASADRMQQLYEKDPEHLALILGILKATREKRSRKDRE